MSFVLFSHYNLILATDFEQMDIAAKEKAMGSCDHYVDMMYSFPHAFTSLYEGENCY